MVVHHPRGKGAIDWTKYNAVVCDSRQQKAQSARSGIIKTNLLSKPAPVNDEDEALKEVSGVT